MGHTVFVTLIYATKTRYWEQSAFAQPRAVAPAPQEISGDVVRT